MKKNINKRGFTLIEVVLVLAIGGLIFLLAFIAFRQASVNRRDTVRRNDVGRVIAELQNYATDNGGSASGIDNGTKWDTFVSQYFGGAISGPQGNYGTSGSLSFSTSTVASPATNRMYFGHDVVCSNNNFSTTGGAGHVAVLTKLEKGPVYCKDDS